MNAEHYRTLDAIGLAELVRRKETSPRELVEIAIEQIEALNPRLNAVIYKAYDYARKLAGREMPLGPLAGVPFLLKDLSLEWQGLPVTNGSRFLRNEVAASNWVIAERMRDAGLIPLGKTNAPEMGWSTSTEPLLYGPTLNPWNDKLVAGGSSGGSGCAIASGMVPIADASDGGGSIRIPASVNGLVGLKPSRGRTTFGPTVVDFWYGAAVFLCLSRSVRDTAAYLDATGGSVVGEPYALEMPEQSYLSMLSSAPRRLKVGFVQTQPDGVPLDTDLHAGVVNAARLCEQLGHDVAPFDFHYDVERMNEVFVRITATLSAAFLQSTAHQRGVRLMERDVEPATWDIYRLGCSLTAIQHANDVEAMRVIALGIARQQAQLDVLITPTLPTAPRPLGWFRAVAHDFKLHTERLMSDIVFTAPWNLSGQPAISLPLHVTKDGAPAGIQFVARLGDEATLLRLAAQLEQAQPWAARRPPVGTVRVAN